MKSSPVYLLSALMLFCLSNFLLAQDEQNNLKKFRTLAWGPPIGSLYYTQSDLPSGGQDNSSGAGYTETQLNIPGAFRSPFYDFDPSKPLKIIRHDGSKIVLVDSLDPSQLPAIPLLLIIPGASNTYTVKVIDDGVNSFPGGSLLCFNFSDFVVKSTFTNDTGVTSETIEPQALQLIRPSFVDQKITAVSVTLPKVPKLIYSSNWVLRNDLRYLIFFVNDPASHGSVHFLRVSDRTEELSQALPKSAQ